MTKYLWASEMKTDGKMVKMCSFQVGTRNTINSFLPPGVFLFFSLVSYQNKGRKVARSAL